MITKLQSCVRLGLGARGLHCGDANESLALAASGSSGDDDGDVFSLGFV